MDIALYLLCLLSIVLCVFAQIKVHSTFNKYSRVGSRAGLTAAEVARRLLDSNGLGYVRIERVHGSLTDHYDSRANVLRLSDAVYANSSAAAVGVAAHEVGHAMQYARKYTPIKIRSALVHAQSFASRFAWITIVLGLGVLSIVNYTIGTYVLLVGIGLFSVIALFELVTLPCEFNASANALEALRNTGMYSTDELTASRKVLTAAALTYVAALVSTVIQLLRLINIARRR